jgi:hypothetical protein
MNSQAGGNGRTLGRLYGAWRGHGVRIPPGTPRPNTMVERRRAGRNPGEGKRGEPDTRLRHLP